jgi:hypothetical protein
MINLLNSIQFDTASMPRLKRNMSNWIKVADMIYKQASEKELLMMIKFEAIHKNRGYVIERLHSRYNALRVKREKKEILEWRQSLKKQSRDI